MDDLTLTRHPGVGEGRRIQQAMAGKRSTRAADSVQDKIARQHRRLIAPTPRTSNNTALLTQVSPTVGFDRPGELSFASRVVRAQKAWM
ncbi:hypothetical protein O1611_g2101 [Lasiodiplodia mahajangana]|uniref:Uncharacterized protein n=1 Tax=Lasiodiplodia mahajangana TaxID=1108764 RepID=A0ACC2JVH2_9PEZI|nr:hypothetical protein O1611_g2101 [Lasiodiplodia mahajangana]